jgi:predicted nucleotidyltransferase
MDEVLTDFLGRISRLRDRISRIILFGSRARSDFKPDSDYDLLLVVPERSAELNEALYDAVMDTLLAHGRLISLKIFSQDDFQQLSSLPTPFMERVASEGVPLD